VYHFTEVEKERLCTPAANYFENGFEMLLENKPTL
jgi:hypothetical protein